MRTTTIGLILKFGEPHKIDKKYLHELIQAHHLENWTIQIIDWRYEPEAGPEYFQSMPEGHIRYVANDFKTLQREKYLASLPESDRNQYADFKSNAATQDLLNQATQTHYEQSGANLERDAAQYYKLTTGKSLDQAVSDYLLLGQLDALFIPGTNFDPQPEYCQGDYNPVKTPPDIRIEKFQRQLIKKAIARGIPVIGVCAASWIIASCFEGATTKALSREELLSHAEGPSVVVDGTSIHPARLSQHSAIIQAGTMLHGIIQNASQWEATQDAQGAFTKTLRKKPAPLEIQPTDQPLVTRVNSTHWRAVAPYHLPQEEFSETFKKATTQQEQSAYIATLSLDQQHQLVISGFDPEHGTIEAFETRFGTPVIALQFHAELRIPAHITQSKTTLDPDYPTNRRVLEAVLIESAQTHAHKRIMVQSIPRAQYLFFRAEHEPASSNAAIELV